MKEFLINVKPVFCNKPRILPRNLPDCIVLEIWVFDNILLANKLFGKCLERFAAYLLVNNNLCGKLIS